jgi:hypothetical protein
MENSRYPSGTAAYSLSCCRTTSLIHPENWSRRQASESRHQQVVAVALFLARGAGQHPAGHGPEVRQDVNAWLRADPVGANGRSLAVDSGIHDSLGMNDRVVGATTVTGAAVGSAPHQAGLRPIAFVRVWAHAPTLLTRSTTCVRRRWMTLHSGQASASKHRCFVHANAQPSSHDNCHLPPLSFKHAGRKRDPRTGPRGNLRLSIGGSPSLLIALSE